MTLEALVALEPLKARAVMESGKWLRVGQVAEIIGVSPSTVRNYIDAGKFRRVRRLTGGDRRVWSESVDEYVRQIEEDQGDPTAADTGPHDD